MRNVTIDRIIQQIEQLSFEERKLLINRLVNELLEQAGGIKKSYPDLSKYKGIAKDVWQEDAQEYVNAMRNDDRQ